MGMVSLDRSRGDGDVTVVTALSSHRSHGTEPP